MLRIKLVKSPVAQVPRTRRTVEALGLKRLHHVVDHEDTPTIRGMVHHVKHMLEVTVIEDSEAKPRRNKPAVKAVEEPVEAPKPKAAAKKPKAEAKPKAEEKK